MANKTLDFLRESKAAEALGLSLRTMQRLRQDGGGPPFMKLTERRIAYSPDALREWADQRVVGSTSAVTASRKQKPTK